MLKILVTLSFSFFLFFIGFSQNMLTGQVTDEADDAMIGVTVFVKENKSVGVTDEMGKFTVVFPESETATLRFSYIGYEDVWQSVSTDQTTKPLNVKLTEKTITLNNVNVVATRAATTDPITYTILEEEDIEQRNLGQDIPFALRYTPSAVVYSDAGAGIGYTYLRIRGTDGSRTNVTINGIPLNDPESQGVFWVNMPDFLSSTTDVQIQRGVGTSTNGAGAFGASINLNTTNIQTKPYGAVNLSGGSFNTRRANVEFGTGLINDKFTFDGRISKIDSDGYIDRASTDLSSFFASAAYLGEKSSLRLTVFSGEEVTYQAWNGVPYELRNIRHSDDGLDRTFNDAGTDFLTKDGDPYDNEVDNYQQTHVQLHFNKTFNRNWHLTAAGHYTQGQGFFEQYKTDESFADYLLDPVPGPDDDNSFFTETDLVRRRWLDNHFFGGVWSVNYFSDNDWTMTLGGGVNRYLGDHFGNVVWAERLPENTDPTHQYYDGTGDKFDFNTYGKLNWNVTPLLSFFTDLQYRYIDYEITGTDNDLRDVSTTDEHHFFNPKFGATYILDKHSQVYLTFGRTNREPARGDYTDTPDGVLPEPETLNNVELGWRRHSEKAYFETTLYFMDYEKQLLPTGVINDVGAPIRTNVPDSYRAGIELVGQYRFNKSLEAVANATFSRNRVGSFTAFTNAFNEDGDFFQEVTEFEGTDIALSPDIITSAEVTWHLLPNQEKQDLSATLSGKFVSEQFLDNTSNENAKLDAYFFSDFRINYQLCTKKIKQINFTFMVNNVFDELYENSGWVYREISAGQEFNYVGVYPQATRNFLVGVGFSF